MRFLDNLKSHYFSNGEYHMDYERQLTAKSIVRFMNDPTGDIPWDEDPSSAAVVHIGRCFFHKCEIFTTLSLPV